jgi:diguanylate cyclase (GGDEF)-like protein/PAS domain S-box-containing protein
VFHADAHVAEAMQAILASNDVRVGEGIAGTVARDRRPIVLSDVPPETFEATTPPQYLPFIREHPIRSLLVVPLLAAGELFGTLGSFRTDSDEPYTLMDVRLLERLAERAALALADALAGPRAIGPADYEAIYRHSRDGVLFTTPDGHILAANPAACDILGRSEREIVLGGREGVVVADDPRLAPALAQRAETGYARAELLFRRGDGTTFVADVSSAIFTTPDHKVRTVLIFRDISDAVEARERVLAKVAELEEAADRDPLSGLLNRRGFVVAAEQALAAADRHGSSCQVLFVDLDGLKQRNDAFGHAAGDTAIVALAGAIDRAVRDADIACRLGGDEFVVLLDARADELAAVVDRIRHELDADGDAPAGLTFSTGVVERVPGMEASLADLIDAADRDMYQQKVLSRLKRRPADEPATGRRGA